MTRVGMATLRGAVAGLALITWADRGLAIEPGDFGQTLQGATIGAVLAAPAPPGFYMAWDSFIAPVGVGTGQNFGRSIGGGLWGAALYWSTGYQFLGANVSMAVLQSFYDAAAYKTEGATLAGNGSGPPFGSAVWFETTGNTLFTPVFLQWTLGNGWFFATGLTLIAPDGSHYNGTLNPDYFTVQPRLALAYVSSDWHLLANLKYDINTASAGRTGSYQLVANSSPVFFNRALASEVLSFGNGYTSGQQAFLDLTATRIFGKLEIGPVASLKWQTTADRPGGGFSCAQVAAVLGPTLSCGRATNYAVGGLVGYNFGPADLQVWITDSVYTRDDFAGWSIFTKLTWKLWSPDAAPSKPLYTKAASSN
jgi:hypothetical protein